MSRGLLPNLLGFARLLRRAGLKLGTGQVLDAAAAVEAVGIERRDDFYWALYAVFVSRTEDRPVFDEAFRRFWQAPAGRDGADPLPSSNLAAPARPPRAAERRVADAWSAETPSRPSGEEQTAARDCIGTYSADETFRHKDFEGMTADEMRRARQLVARLDLHLANLPVRRFRPDARGPRVDLRRTLRASLRGGGGVIPLARRRRVEKPPALVALCDISGSMTPYARVILHFLHALTASRRSVHTFVFGTRLSNATHALRHRDPDDALNRLGMTVPDWDGGTRIGACLAAFNLRWARRVLGHGAVVLLITDGLDRGDAGTDLARQAERLRRSCRRLIWLNPLLRYAEFQPRAQGVRALLPHVDEMRPVHDLASLEDLARVLGMRTPARRSNAAA
ncbi:MAG: vWA domain-containing protein [Longimicrobiaceae bacterium]